jgi:hypothetical protein
MTRCYEIMRDLPTVPREYVDLAFRTVNESQVPPQNPSYQRLAVKNGKVSTSRTNPRFGLESIMADWVDAYISQDWLQISISNSVTVDQNNCQDHIHGAHTDTTRQYALLYLLEASNSDQTTIFYQEPNKGVRRRRGLFLENMDELIQIDSITIPLQTWIYFDTSILHAVENIQNSRVAIQISFDCEPFGVFIKD